MQAYATDVLVTKDAGGTYPQPKLTAAEGALDVVIVAIRRPSGPASVPTVHTVDDALNWVNQCA